MNIRIKLPYQFFAFTHMTTVEMEFQKKELSYGEIIETFGQACEENLRRLILDENGKTGVLLIVDNRCLSPDAKVCDGAEITLMMPLEGG